MTGSCTGELHVANDVLADYAGHAVMQCYGIVGVTSASKTDGFTKILPASRLRRGVEVETTEEGVVVDVHVIVEYGTNINVVSQNLIDAITFNLSNYARVPVAGVNVHIEDVKAPK